MVDFWKSVWVKIDTITIIFSTSCMQKIFLGGVYVVWSQNITLVKLVDMLINVALTLNDRILLISINGGI